MALILRTCCNSDGTSRHGFQWPTEGSVEAPDWDPTPKCGGGLHGLLNGRGDPDLLDWTEETKWLLVEVDEGSLVDLKGKIKFPKGDVVFFGDREAAIQTLAEKTGLKTVREWICEDPQWAYRYALEIDKEPRDDTRKAACKDPRWAYWYARDVDKSPRDDTREAACKDPGWAYWYAHFVDKAPRDDTRESACKDPGWAYEYALNVEKSSGRH